VPRIPDWGGWQKSGCRRARGGGGGGGGRAKERGREEGREGGREGGKHSAACKFDLVELSVAYIVSCKVTVAWLSAGYNEFGIGERGTTGGLGDEKRKGDDGGGGGGARRCVASIICLGGFENTLARSRERARYRERAKAREREKEMEINRRRALLFVGRPRSFPC